MKEDEVKGWVIIGGRVLREKIEGMEMKLRVEKDKVGKSEEEVDKEIKRWDNNWINNEN